MHCSMHCLTTYSNLAWHSKIRQWVSYNSSVVIWDEPIFWDHSFYLWALRRQTGLPQKQYAPFRICPPELLTPFITPLCGAAVSVVWRALQGKCSFLKFTAGLEKVPLHGQGQVNLSCHIRWPHPSSTKYTWKVLIYHPLSTVSLSPHLEFLDRIYLPKL